MAQKQIDITKIQDQIKSGLLKTASTQTGNGSEFILYLGQNKNASIYFSPVYKEVVLSYNFCSKSFIITKSMWKVLRKHLSEIDSLLLKND